MGAEDQSFTVVGGNEQHVRSRIKAAHENDLHECGHGGYTGSWAEWNGGVDFHNETFKNKTLAYDYLFGKFTKKAGKEVYTPGVVQKWEDAIVVQYRNDKGQLVWLVGACFSC
jgi:hypothetical protein